MGYGMGGYNVGYYGGYGPGLYGGYGAASYGAGGYGASWGIRWIYALLILIVIVLQFGRNRFPSNVKTTTACGDDGAVCGDGFGTAGAFTGNFGEIDNSVLFIIIIFLLVLCGGCWFGGYGGGYGW